MKKSAWVLLLALSSCVLDEKKLLGKWQASGFFENGQTVHVPLQEIDLELFANKRYVFHAAFKYSEAGRYRTSLHYLFLTDTTVFPTKEKKLKVEFLSADTLKIRMQNAGKQQVLFLAKTAG